MTFYCPIEFNALKKFLRKISFFKICRKFKFQKYFTSRPSLDRDQNYGRKGFMKKTQKQLSYFILVRFLCNLCLIKMF